MRWWLPAELLLVVGSLHILPTPVSASPAISVGVNASFNRAPYLVELLETAADERPSVYFKILDRIAEGYFKDSTTDQQLYNKFLKLLEHDKLITEPQSLSSFNLALSIRNSAPRIEAHYQYYKTSVEPLLEKAKAENCVAWLEFTGRQFCSPQFEKADAVVEGLRLEGSPILPFDRSLGSGEVLPAIVYADITSPIFPKFHLILSEAAKNGRVSYRIRHKPSTAPKRPLEINGFGVELALKRTDYIVIDDRQAEEGKGNSDADAKAVQAELDETGEIADLKPLSSSELEELSLRTASYIIGSEQPLDTLLKVTQDFPKYSSYLAAQNVSESFLKEHMSNREMVLPSGYNVMWINGVQYNVRQMDPYSILDSLRRERRLVNNFEALGFTSAQAIQLLSHPAISAAQADPDVQRYDWRDENEGGKVIMWMNDLEKDKRYSDWGSSLYGLLQRTYPGQLPSVARDIHNAIIPVDFSDPKQVMNVVETVADFVKRKIPVRFGLVPLTHTEQAAEQAKAVYHILDTYGISALLEYLEHSLSLKKTAGAHEPTFKKIMEKRKAKPEREAMALQQVLQSEGIDSQIINSRQYLQRLGAKGSTAPILVNGVPIKNDDEWLQALSGRVSVDLRLIQRGVFEEKFEEDMWLPGHFLETASLRRNPLIVPENEKDIKLLNLVNVLTEGLETSLKDLPTMSVAKDSIEDFWTQILVVGDFDTHAGLQLILDAIDFRKEHDNVELTFINNGNTRVIKSPRIRDFWPNDISDWTLDNVEGVYKDVESLVAASNDVAYDGINYWPDSAPLLDALGFSHAESGIVINGRSLGPINADTPFTKEDFETLYSFEVKKRTRPAANAIKALDLADLIKDPLTAAKLCSVLAVSTVSDLPEGIFELPPPIRSRIFYEWSHEETAFTIGDNSTALFQIVVALDPASESAQRWTPILKVLSELDGVFMRIFLNPKERLSELPIKRFYRYALEKEPSFDSDGKVKAVKANFIGIPKETLLTVGMDVPPSWLVAPKETVHDLDNIKLSSLTAGADVEATYELENIMIEGHSRDTTNSGMAPRGAQLVLSSAKETHVADTIIMANLGYFQFKANPGLYNISLQPGLSQKIFNIDSVGALGHDPQPGDENTEVALLSFQGVTLYPRLSRKPGMEEEDVLGTPKTGGAADIVSKGAGIVDGWLKKAGVKEATGTTQADINIFSVASGHLYERMLNIMMVSVMRHTKHTVKFWFIENFLSSSFKEFLPSLAKEYGFQYEMVTYKWPHWLRAQKEKQREIWGYKILFLDVLFPLDLDKVIFVDADQIVRTDMYELVNHDLEGAPYGFTPMCDSRTEMEGFRFWKQGYWKNFLRGLPYHISALYVIDLKRFRQIAAGDRLRQQYHQLSADPNSLSNLDQDLPNNMQTILPIHSLPQEWLWCETWCSDESLKDAKTIDLCNNPQTKEPKLDRARRQVPEWTEYDDEIAALAKRIKTEVPSGKEQQGTEEKPVRNEGKTGEKSGRPSVKDEL